MSVCVCCVCVCVCVCVLVNKYVWGEMIVVCVHLCTNWLRDMCVYVYVLCMCTCVWVKGIWLHDTIYVPVNKYMYM